MIRITFGRTYTAAHAEVSFQCCIFATIFFVFLNGGISIRKPTFVTRSLPTIVKQAMNHILPGINFAPHWLATRFPAFPAELGVQRGSAGGSGACRAGRRRIFSEWQLRPGRHGRRQGADRLSSYTLLHFVFRSRGVACAPHRSRRRPSPFCRDRRGHSCCPRGLDRGAVWLDELLVLARAAILLLTD